MEAHLRNRKAWTTSAAVLALVLCGIRHAAAVPILDQSFVPQDPHSFFGTGGTNLNSAQTFTVGITGMLSQVDVLVEKNGPDELRLDVRPTVDGLPIEDDNAALASVTVPFATIPSPRAFLSFDVSSFGVRVSQGELLAIVLTGNARWYGVTPELGPDDPYLGGAAYFRGLPGAFFPPFDGRADLGFRTFVDAIPEPPTIMLFGIGVVGLVLAVRACRAGGTSLITA